MTTNWIVEGLAKPGKTRSGIADAIGRHPSTVTHLLQGKRELKAREIEKIARYLEVSPPVKLMVQPSTRSQTLRACIEVAHHTLTSGNYSDADARAVAKALLENVLRMQEVA